MGRRVLCWIEWGLAGAAGLLALMWAVDWAVWSLHGRKGQQVEVFRVTVVSLKGNKEEYYPEGSSMVACSESWLLEGGAARGRGCSMLVG